MRHAIVALILLPVCMFAVNPKHARALDLPGDALRMIAETTTDPCPICVQRKLEEAFAVLAARLQPGFVLETDSACRLMKTGPEDDFRLSLTCHPSAGLVQALAEGQKPPDVTFVFYTSEKHLVGISEGDHTEGRIMDVFRGSPPGTVFEGQLRLISYRYGDGPSFNYLPTSNGLLIHCTILRLTPLRP